MSYLFCENRSEMEALIAQANREKVQVLEEFAQYVNTGGGVVDIDVTPVKHTSGVWSVEADLTFNGEVVRHYEAYDLLVLDLYQIELAVLAKNTGKAATQ